MLNFVIFWEARGFFRFFNFVKNAQFCHFVRGSWIFFASSILSKCSILSFWERTVNLFTSSILSEMLNFVIFWEGWVFFSHFNIVKNDPFCHFWKVDFKLWDKHKYAMSTHYVLWYSKLFLSNMPHFITLREARVFFRFFNFVKNAQFCHFLREESIFFFTFSILSKMVHLVIFEKWTSNYEISIKEYYVYTMCCDISNYFCQKCPILSFCERLVYFSLLQFCQKCLILSFCERPVYFFASSILSKMLNFVIFWEAHGFFDSSILSKMLNFVIFSERPVHFFQFFNFCQK